MLTPCTIDPLHVTSLIIINNPVAILEDRWGASVLQLEQGGAGLVQVRVRSYNGEFCAVVGCGNRSDREEKISFYRLPALIFHQSENPLVNQVKKGGSQEFTGKTSDPRSIPMLVSALYTSS